MAALFEDPYHEEKRIRAQAWREANRERHREYQRQYRRDHIAECYARNRRWAVENREAVNAAHKRSREKHPESYKAMALKWRAKNPDARRLFCANRRARIKGSGGIITPQEWDAIKRKHGFKCLRCGKKKPLTLDHVIPLSTGGPHAAHNIQPLCLNCNSSKSTKTIDYR